MFESVYSLDQSGQVSNGKVRRSNPSAGDQLEALYLDAQTRSALETSNQARLLGIANERLPLLAAAAKQRRILKTYCRLPSWAKVALETYYDDRRDLTLYRDRGFIAERLEPGLINLIPLTEAGQQLAYDSRVKLRKLSSKGKAIKRLLDQARELYERALDQFVGAQEKQPKRRKKL
jgi:hypothetical protein